MLVCVPGTRPHAPFALAPDHSSGQGTLGYNPRGVTRIYRCLSAHRHANSVVKELLPGMTGGHHGEARAIEDPLAAGGRSWHAGVATDPPARVPLLYTPDPSRQAIQVYTSPRSD